MIEAALYIALGALCISLLLFAVLPIVSGRARRLAINELERQAPVSLSEITAQKDQMRAKFAVDMNRQEKRVNKLQSDTHQHLISAERWRGHAQSVEMEFDKLTDEYASTKKKFMRLEEDLEKQKGIAKSALKTPTGKQTQARLTLESEVDELRAEKSAASVKIVSLQTELSKSYSRVAEMERVMPSLEELDLRRELKSLAEDVSKYVKGSPPMQRTAHAPIAEQAGMHAPAAITSANARAAEAKGKMVIIPQLVLKSQASVTQEAPKTSTPVAVETTVPAPITIKLDKPVALPEPPAAEPKTTVASGMARENGSEQPSRLIVTPASQMDEASKVVSKENANGANQNGVHLNGNNINGVGVNGNGTKALPQVAKLGSTSAKTIKGSSGGTINFSAAKTPTKLTSKSGVKPVVATGKPEKTGKPDNASGSKKTSDARTRNHKSEATSS